MKHYALVACLLIALTAASCSASHKLVELNGDHFKRVASIENRCKDNKDCENQASAYATSHKISMPDPVSFSPLTYSFSEGNGANKQEILYKVSSLLPTSITYYETKKPPGPGYKDNVKLLKDAVDALKAELGADLTETTLSVHDDYQTNGKIPCRVLLNTKKAIELKDSKGKTFLSIIGDFGMIINPPYPP